MNSHFTRGIVWPVCALYLSVR